MVWMTLTGEKALQVHTKCVRKMFLRPTPASEVKVIDDLVEIRKLLHGWYERILRPEYVLMSPVEDGDVQMWDNWSVFHSAVDYPDHYGPRSKPSSFKA
jgi:alpha-ketoglutarate-dependent taurine dioxygenase